MAGPSPMSCRKFSPPRPITWDDRAIVLGTPDHWNLTAMTNPHRSAELIPFDQVHRLVQERRQRASALADLDRGSLMAARTSQVRRLLSESRSARATGPDVA